MNMWHAVWKIEVRKTGPWFLGVLLVIVGYTLFEQTPLGSDDIVPALVGGFQGWALAFRLFRDRGGTQSFVFSRPLSRGRLFWYRWGIGLGLQALTLAVLVLAVALGARQGIQQSGMFRSPWYPMVRWYEISVLWPVGVCSLAVYQASAFVILRNQLLSSTSSAHRARWRSLADGGLTAILVLFGAPLLAGVLFVPSAERGHLPGLVGKVLLAYVLVLAILTTVSSLHCHRRLEVEA